MKKIKSESIVDAEIKSVDIGNLQVTTEKIANSYYNNKLGDKEDYCIYTDTDSVFYSAIPLVQKEFPNADSSFFLISV